MMTSLGERFSSLYSSDFKRMARAALVSVLISLGSACSIARETIRSTSRTRISRPALARAFHSEIHVLSKLSCAFGGSGVVSALPALPVVPVPLSARYTAWGTTCAASVFPLAPPAFLTLPAVEYEWKPGRCGVSRPDVLAPAAAAAWDEYLIVPFA